MKIVSLRFVFLFLSFISFAIAAAAQSPHGPDNLVIVIIRHGEKPANGDNLTCQGLNRSLQLPKLLYKKFGVPAYTYVPALAGGENVHHARMFQTITPFAIRYNLSINSRFEGNDYDAIAADLKKKTGTVLLVWDHKEMGGILRKLGIKDAPEWPADDYDSIWIITFAHGKASLRKDKEGLHPAADCPF